MSAPVSVVFLIDNIETSVPGVEQALRQLIHRFQQRRLEVTCKFTGERARQVRRLVYPELTIALKTQDIGLYGNFHVDQPTPAEYVGDLGWMEGARKFFIQEAPGYDDVCHVGGRIPSCFGNESWSPHSYGALSRWGIRVRLSRHCFLSDNERPFFFGARLNLSQLGANWLDIGPTITDPKAGDHWFEKIAERVWSFGGKAGVVVVQMYADDLLARRTPDFWKRSSQENAAGLLKEAEACQRGLDNLDRILDRLIGLENAKIHSARQVADRFADISYERRIQLEDLRAIARHAAIGKLEPFKYEAGYLAPSEQLYILARAWDETRRKGKLIRNSTLQAPLGPAELVSTEPSVSGIWAKELPDVLANLLAFIHKFARLPDSVETADGAISVQDLLPTLAGGFHDELEAVDLPLRQGKLANADRVDEKLARTCWKVPVHPPEFEVPRQIEIARQQLWTYKPVLEITG
ncbi:MAG: hypothetical protein U1D30_21685 [Planctomycetota bacterium]